MKLQRWSMLSNRIRGVRGNTVLVCLWISPAMSEAMASLIPGDCVRMPSTTSQIPATCRSSSICNGCCSQISPAAAVNPLGTTERNNPKTTPGEHRPLPSMAWHQARATKLHYMEQKGCNEPAQGRPRRGLLDQIQRLQRSPPL